MLIQALEQTINSGSKPYPIYIGFLKAQELLSVAEVPNFNTQLQITILPQTHLLLRKSNGKDRSWKIDEIASFQIPKVRCRIFRLPLLALATPFSHSQQDTSTKPTKL